MKIEALEATLRSRTQAELFALLAHCREVSHSWKVLETDLGRHAHYCARCLRVAVGDGAEFWPTFPERSAL